MIRCRLKPLYVRSWSVSLSSCREATVRVWRCFTFILGCKSLTSTYMLKHIPSPNMTWGQFFVLPRDLIHRVSYYRGSEKKGIGYRFRHSRTSPDLIFFPVNRPISVWQQSCVIIKDYYLLLIILCGNSIIIINKIALYWGRKKQVHKTCFVIHKLCSLL